MAESFETSAEYYDTIHAEKDYEGEAEYVHNLIKVFSPGHPNTILDLGCGTGKHLQFLQESHDYNCIGVERNASLGRQAHKRGITVLPYDIRSLDTGREYDTIISLFHTPNYMVTNRDIEQFFTTIETHYSFYGCVILNVLYGPQHLIEGSNTQHQLLPRIDRLKSTKLLPQENLLHITEEIKIEDKAVSIEHHSMRYFFLPEIMQWFKGIGLKVVYVAEWMTDAPIGNDTRELVVVAR